MSAWNAIINVSVNEKVLKLQLGHRGLLIDVIEILEVIVPAEEVTKVVS